MFMSSRTVCDQNTEDLEDFACRKPVFLYVGNLSLRKGIPRLLETWKRIGGYRHFTLRLIGSNLLREEYLKRYASYFEYIPSLPRRELARYYRESYAFVFPTVADGFGLVMNEALAKGLPVIAVLIMGHVDL